MSPLPLPSDQDASGRTLGDEEIAAVTAALRSGTLTSTKGAFVKQLENRWAATLGVRRSCADPSVAVLACQSSSVNDGPTHTCASVTHSAKARTRLNRPGAVVQTLH